MIKFIVAFDDKNAEIGDYCNACHKDLVGFLSEQNHPDVTSIEGQYCTIPNIDSHFPIDTNHFFIAYSHGNKTSLTCSGEAYVKLGQNSTNFQQSFFYTTACLAGVELGKLMQSLVFVGFDKEISHSITYQDIFVKCDNAILKAFLSKDITAYDAYNQALAYYNQEIDKLSTFKDFTTHSLLLKARESLVFY